MDTPGPSDQATARRERQNAARRRSRAKKKTKRLNGPYRATVSGAGVNAVDAIPVVEFMERYIGQPMLGGTEQRGWNQIARVTGITARSLWRIRHTGRAHIATLDTILIRLDGPPLSHFYPRED